MKAFADDQHAAPKLDASDSWVTKRARPILQPCASRSGIVDSMKQRRHQMRLTEATLANHDDWPALVRPYRLYAFQKVVRRVRNLQEVLCRNLASPCSPRWKALSPFL